MKYKPTGNQVVMHATATLISYKRISLLKKSFVRCFRTEHLGQLFLMRATPTVFSNRLHVWQLKRVREHHTTELLPCQIERVTATTSWPIPLSGSRQAVA